MAGEGQCTPRAWARTALASVLAGLGLAGRQDGLAAGTWASRSRGSATMGEHRPDPRSAPGPPLPAKPGRQRQRKPPPGSCRQSRVCAAWQAPGRHSLISASQRRPVYPGGQAQRKPPTRSTQVPLCKHLGPGSRGGPGPQSSSLISQRTPGGRKIRGGVRGGQRPRLPTCPPPWPWHTQRPRGTGAEVPGHKVNAEAPMLAGLRGTLIHVILTVVTSVAGRTLW